MSEPDQSNHGPAPLTEDQRQHLEFIQAVISRLASSSATAKTLVITIATAAFGFSSAQAVPAVAILGVAVVVVFGILDARYLREERLFRYLYDDARKGNVEVFSMKKDEYSNRCTLRQVIFSWSVAWGFYGPLVVVGLFALAWAALT